MLDWIKAIANGIDTLVSYVLLFGSYVAGFFRALGVVLGRVWDIFAMIPAWLSVPCLVGVVLAIAILILGRK